MPQKPLSPDRFHSTNEMAQQLMKLQSRLRLGFLPKLSARALIEAALPLANSSTTLAERVAANMFFARDATHLTRSAAPDCPDRDAFVDLYRRVPNPMKKGMKENDLRDGLEAWWIAFTKQVSWFRESLDLVVDDPVRARKEFSEGISHVLTKMVIIPTVTWDGRNSHTDLEYIALDGEDICIYVLMLLLDERERLYESLRECKLQDCKRYFLVNSDRIGGPKPLYCSPEHRLLASVATQSERTRRYRERLKQARKAK